MKIWTQHACDVCRLLDADSSLKECFYCLACKAWICRADNYRMDRRGHAMLLMHKEKKAGCPSCRKEGAIPRLDPSTGKSIGQMNYAERLAYDRQLHGET